MQARREGDLLYNLVIEANAAVHREFSQRNREYLFLVRYLTGISYFTVGPNSEEELRTTVLFFVEEVLLLEAAISQLSAEKFDGQPILFADSALKLKEQVDLADRALRNFNLMAQKLKFTVVTADAVRDELRVEVDQQISRWMILARICMLSEYGEETDLRASFDQLVRSSHTPWLEFRRD